MLRFNHELKRILNARRKAIWFSEVMTARFSPTIFKPRRVAGLPSTKENGGTS